MYRSQAFTLIELLIVTAMLSILMVLSYPAYKSYLVKAKVTEILNVGSSYKDKALLGNDFPFVEEIDSKYIQTVKIAESSDDNHPIIEVSAKMQDQNESGIGISNVNHIPLTLQLHGIQKGQTLSWSCLINSEYQAYSPGICEANQLEYLTL